MLSEQRKRCNTCDELLPLTQFAIRRKDENQFNFGRQPHCLSCNSRKNKIWKGNKKRVEIQNTGQLFFFNVGAY